MVREVRAVRVHGKWAWAVDVGGVGVGMGGVGVREG